MRLLLDTHAVIWWAGEPDRLPRHVRDACEDPGNELILSVVCILEMQIKTDAGKLRFGVPLQELVTRLEQANGFRVLPVTAAHVYAIGELPRLHKDPFDRLLIAQANVENARLVSGDEVVARYPVEVFW